mmetsp:Transcript_36140/g.85722  ORF Transcript_36140/g.85722 Transcript_36140/m.85722 type:complete len:200 (+) Transcript_36140:66-665(+)
MFLSESFCLHSNFFSLRGVSSCLGSRRSVKIQRIGTGELQRAFLFYPRLDKRAHSLFFCNTSVQQSIDRHRRCTLAHSSSKTGNGLSLRNSLDMFVLGLTGSIGMGKSTVSDMLRKIDIPVLDSDATVHALYSPGGGAVEAVRQLFPGAIVDGGVDRQRLSKLVVGNEVCRSTFSEGFPKEGCSGSTGYCVVCLCTRKR